jgi:uncharacterized protein (TIGR00730 family)
MTSVCVYCGSSFGSDPVYEAVAAETGRLIAAAGMRLVYGGGSVGLMGVVARAAFHAGGEVIGIIPAFLRYAEIPEDEVTRMHIVDSMHQRKQMMFEMSDGFISLPGGIGTLDETIEMMTWAQLGRHGKPILLVDTAGYWTTFETLMRQIVANGFARPSLSELYRIVPDPAAALRFLQGSKPPDA